MPQLTKTELPIKHGHGAAQDDCPKCQDYLAEVAANLGRQTTGRLSPRPNHSFSDRIPTTAAHGVRSWYRKLSGRWFRFTLVVDGWWGTGPTGTLTVDTQISNGDWYPIHQFAPASA